MAVAAVMNHDEEGPRRFHNGGPPSRWSGRGADAAASARRHPLSALFADRGCQVPEDAEPDDTLRGCD